MGRSPSCFCAKDDDEGLNRRAWTASEDKILSEYIKIHGVGGWSSLPKKAGLKRCGKSCRLRWLNYLRPDIKRGNISPDEEELIIRLHRLLGNRWSLIAGRLPGRTDNEIKNYWNTHMSKKVKMADIEPKYQKPFPRRDVPYYSNYDDEGVVDKDNYTSQITPLETTAVRYCERAVAAVDNPNSYNSDHVLDTYYGIIPEEEGSNGVDGHAVEIDISKSWCQLLLEDCVGDYQYDRLELIDGLQANNSISSSYGTDEHHQFPSLSPHQSKISQEKHSSSCNHFNSTIFAEFSGVGTVIPSPIYYSRSRE